MSQYGPQDSAAPSTAGSWGGRTFSELAVTGGRIRYRRMGAGQPVLFVHGVFVNSELWRNVVPTLSDRFDCVVPDLPLGSHELPMDPGAALSPPDLAAILAEIIEKLKLGPVRIVANDSGGALTQILAARRPELVHSIVLTSCDAYEYFFPPMFRTLPLLARIPGGLAAMAQLLRLGWFRRLPLSYGWVTAKSIPAEVLDGWVTPMRRSPAVRRDLAAVLRNVRAEYTLAAAEQLRSFDGNVLLVWGEYDKVFPLRFAHRLARDLRHAELVTLPATGAFVPEDSPARLAELVGDFFTDPAPAEPS
jgi:pimeloyl-ACP methyl ester carboxylesterase